MSDRRSGFVREKAYRHIQKKILAGTLRAGAALSEISLAKELKSSRTPVREAIGQLVAEGFLEQIPNRGTMVVQLTRRDIVDLYELREALEVYAVGKAARNPPGAAQFEQLEELVAQTMVFRDYAKAAGADSLDRSQMHRFMVNDLTFHTLLMRAAGNGRIVKVANDTRVLVRIFGIRLKGHSATQLEKIHDWHGRILGAVRGRDAEAAMRAMAGHIEESKQERLASYDRWERESSMNVGTLFEDVEFEYPPRSGNGD